MSSILTNNSAMVALQTLNMINKDLAGVQSEISTGKTINSAKDNSAVWAISKTMESDVKGFNAISESLSLGDSTVAVAADAAETTTDLLNDIKEKIVAAQESNVDREKIQTDINALSDQIASVTQAAQFNGLNLVEGGDDVAILSSLDRDENGNVTASEITVERQDLSQDGGTFGDGADLTKATVTGAGLLDSASNSADTTFDVSGLSADESIDIEIAGVTVSAAYVDGVDTNETLRDKFTAAFNDLKDGGQEEFQDLTISDVSDGFRLTRDGLGDAVTVTSAEASVTEAAIDESGDKIVFDDTSVVNDSYQVTVGGQNFVYVADGPVGGAEIAANLAGQINNAGIAGVVATSEDGTLRLGQTDGSVVTFSAAQKADGVAGGDLSGLAGLDVTTDEGAEAALAAIEGMIQSSIEAAADFGSVRGRIETQSEFVGQLSDSLTSGIGALVDADMEEASARLQALQVQQELGIQSLSIANEQPQTLLQLFR